MQKIVVSDMDDVLVDLIPAWVDLLNKQHNRNVNYKDITEWDMHISYPGLTDKELFGVLNTEELWKSVQPKVNAVEGVKRFIDDGYKFYVCTASHYKTIANKMTHALFPYFNLNYQDIIVCHDKHLIHCDYIVDDNPENLKHSSAIRFLMDTPHNQKADMHHYDFRVSSLLDMYNIIKELERLENE